MRPEPRPYERYRHFKGNEYQVLLLATNSEDESINVVYQALYGDYKVYVRPLDSFMSKTDHVKYPDAKQKYRFEKIEISAAFEHAEKKPGKTEINRETNSEEPESDRLEAGDEPVSGVSITDAEAVAIAASWKDAIKKETSKVTEEKNMPDLDPAVIEYLDADTNEQKLNILTGVHHRITEEMITTMSIATDFEVAEGDIEQKYQELKNCLLMKIKFEKTR